MLLKPLTQFTATTSRKALASQWVYCRDKKYSQTSTLCSTSSFCHPWFISMLQCNSRLSKSLFQPASTFICLISSYYPNYITNGHAKLFLLFFFSWFCTFLYTSKTVRWFLCHILPASNRKYLSLSNLCFESIFPAPEVCLVHWLSECKHPGVKCSILPSKGEHNSSCTHFRVFLFWETKQNKQKQTNAPFSPVALNLTSLWSTLTETAAKLSLKLYSP